MTTANTISTPAGHLAGIHALRGVAALMVFLFHLHYVGKIPLPQSWGLVASHGGMGVELFFVLSAFSLLHSNQKFVVSPDGRWLEQYLAKRFFRIAPLFYAMLLIHCLLIVYVQGGKIDPLRLLINILFLFNFAPKESEGIVWASWSIGVEMVFYAFLPLVMMTVRSMRAAAMLWFVAALASYAYRRILERDAGIPAAHAHFAFVSQVGVFCAGVLGYWTFAKLRGAPGRARRRYAWTVVIFGPVLALGLLSDTLAFLAATGRPDTQLWGLAFGFIAAATATIAAPWMAHPVLQHLGERSYSIYLTHALVIYAVGPFIQGLYESAYPTLGGYGFALAAAAALVPTLIVSEVTYRLIEVPGIAMGRRLLQHRATSAGLTPPASGQTDLVPPLR